MGTAPHQQETVITTRTTEVQQAPGAIIQKNIPTTQMIQKDAVVTNVMEKPVLQNVIEKKHVEVHHKPVVQEIHEQKIIEIEKQNVIQNVQQQAQFSQTRAETRFEEIGSSQLGEQERLRLSQLNLNQAPKVIQQQGAVQQIQEKEVVGQVIKQEYIEKHVQPVITEVREQKVVQEVVHPVVRKVYEAPIVREVTSTVAPTVIHGTSTFQQGTQFQQGSTFVQQPAQTGFVQQTTTTTEKQGFGQKLSGMLHHDKNTTQQQQGFQQQPIQSNYQQTTTTQKQGLGQKLSGMLHHDKNTTQQQQGFTQQQQGFQQQGFTQQQGSFNQGSNFQSNNALLQNQQGFGNNLTTTTTTQHWGAPNSSVTTSGGSAELNMLNQEQKVINKEGGLLTGTENANLRQHEAVVEAVAHNPGAIQQLQQQQGMQRGPVKNL